MIQLISETRLKKDSLIDDNTDGIYLVPAIQCAQEIGLQPIIGGPLYKKILSLVDSGDIQTETDYKELLDEYCIPFLIYKVMSEIQIPLAFKMRNQGIVNTSDDHSNGVDIRDVQYLKTYYDEKAIFYSNRLSDYLCANSSKFPEYRQCIKGEMKSNKTAYNTNIYLGNSNCKKSLRNIFNN